MRVVARLELQIDHHLRRYPTGAQFVPGEALLVEHQNVDAGGFQALGGGCSGGTAANHDNLCASHGDRAQFVYIYWRVGGRLLLVCVVTSTWKSCSVPVSKAAIEPAR